MTLEQKAGQLIMIPLMADGGGAGVAQAVSGRHVGAVLLLGPGWDSTAKVSDAAADLKAAAQDAPAPLWIAADQEGGQVQRLKGGGFDAIPSALEQGKLDPAALREQAQGWGAQLADAGVNVDLAPVLDTVDAAARASNAPIGALDRDFGLDAAGNSAHGAAFLRGMAQAGLATAVKHFPGLGRVTGNTDYTSTGITDTVTAAGDPSIQAFADAFEARPTMVMMSLATYTQIDPAAPAAFSRAAVTDLLREQLGWQGVVISDSLTADAVKGVPARDRAVRFVDAGGDLSCYGSAQDALSALDGLVAKAQADQDFAALVEAAAGRVLTAKGLA
jgi:beta-N-acetylhexosaminidase